MNSITQKNSLKPVFLFILGAIGTCISFIHIINFYFFGTGIGETSLSLFNMLYQLTNAVSKVFPISGDTFYLLIIASIILLSIFALIYNIIKNNLRTYSIWLLLLNLLFSLPTLLLFFIGWAMNASS